MVKKLWSFRGLAKGELLTGFTLIEILIGIALMLVVFLGIFGIAQLSFRVIAQSKARVTAIALANQKSEFSRNLSYGDVGTIGGVPPGTISQNENVVRNNIPYTIRTTIVYIDDPFDGVAPADSLPNDYKRVKVKVSWQIGAGGEVSLNTDVAPRGLETSVGGGNLSMIVFDALGAPISQADIHIVNSAIIPSIDVYYQTNNEGNFLLAGAPAAIESYEITVSKAGYSADRTYGRSEVANPEKPHASVLEGQLTQISFSIDRLGGFAVDTLSTYGTDSFSDSFLNETKISEINDIVILGGRAVLATTTDGYLSSGYIISQEIANLNLMNWEEFSWNDSEPMDTEIKYQVFYATSTDWYIIPDSDLFGNSVGFGISPVDLASISTSTYPKLKLKGNFSTNATSTTPELFDWQISWRTTQSVSIPNTPFNLRGAKIIGTDASEAPVYKYSQNQVSSGNGHVDIAGLEWDSYTFSVNKAVTDLNLSSTNPAPQPIGLLPNVNQPVVLYLTAENSLLVKLKDNETNESVFGASFRLFNVGFGYNKTQFTDTKGETLFIPLENGVYNYETQAAGYQNASGTISVFGDTTRIIYLIPQGQ